MAKAIPEGYHSIAPYLVMRHAADAIEFYKQAFGAVEIYRLLFGEGKVAHAELQIGSSRLLLADEVPGYGAMSAFSIGGTPVALMHYVENVDEVADRFVKAGGKVIRPVEVHFYGDRSGQFEDPEGYKWILSSRVEDVSPEEMKRRMDELERQ